MLYSKFVGDQTPPRSASFRALLVASVMSAATPLFGGELPLVMDNPGTVETGRWEIDAGWSFARADGVTEHGLPSLGFIRGLTPRVDLAYAIGWAGIRGDGIDGAWALGDSALTLKWRFYDGGEEHWCASVTPIASFRTPGSKAVERGLSDGGTTWSLPFQLHRCCGATTYSFDGGFTHATRSADSWAGGAAISRQISQRVELGGEVRLTTDAHGRDAVLTVYAEAAVQFGESCFLLATLGRDATVPSGASRATSGYVGLRWYP